MIDRPSIEKKEFDEFLLKYRHGRKYRGQRLGQAFYDHFKLSKMDQSPALSKIYEAYGDNALALIHETFNIS